MADNLRALRSDDCINDCIRKLGVIESLRDNLHEDYFDKIEIVLEIAMRSIIAVTGTFLQGNGHGIRNQEVSADTLVKIVKEMPTCLKVGSFDNEYRYPVPDQPLIIHQAAQVYPMIVPFLAKVAVEVNTGGYFKSARGGLLSEDPNIDLNVLQQLAWKSTDQTNNLAALVELRSVNLFVESDIIRSDLVRLAFSNRNMTIFRYLVDWDSHGLKTSGSAKCPFIHMIINFYDLYREDFNTFLEATMRHYRDEAGLLFQKDDRGITAFKKVVQELGLEDTFDIIGLHIPFDNPSIPILHHVASDAPDLVDVFISHYSSSVRKVKDDTGLHPFMTAAMGSTKDHISATYSLLRKDISLVLDCVEVQSPLAEMKGGKGRKRNREE